MSPVDGRRLNVIAMRTARYSIPLNFGIDVEMGYSNHFSQTVDLLIYHKRGTEIHRAIVSTDGGHCIFVVFRSSLLTVFVSVTVLIAASGLFELENTKAKEIARMSKTTESELILPGKDPSA